MAAAAPGLGKGGRSLAPGRAHVVRVFATVMSGVSRVQSLGLYGQAMVPQVGFEPIDKTE